MLESARRPLVCLHYGIGDVVMQLPVLNSLIAFLPQASITLLGADPAIELLQDDRRWQAVQSIQGWSLGHWWDEGNESIGSTIEDWIERHEFDVILDVSHAVQAVRDVVWRGNRPILDTGRYLPSYGLNGVDAIKASVRAEWGLTVPQDEQPRIALGEHRMQFADAYLARCKWNGKPPIGISALASSPLKRWPPRRLAEVANALSARFDLPVMIFAGPAPRIAAELVTGMNKRTPLIVVGALHLLDTAALLARCAVLICNDTGLMHMAAAVETPVVAVFGPTAESIYLPRISKAKGISSTVECPFRRTRTFGPSRCLVMGRCLMDRPNCIDSIPAATVLQTSTDILVQVWEQKTYADA